MEREGSYFRHLSWFKKFIFIIGWVWAITPIFWLVILIASLIKRNHLRFWNPRGYSIVNVFGWFEFILLIIAIFAFAMSKIVG